MSSSNNWTVITSPKQLKVGHEVVVQVCHGTDRVTNTPVWTKHFGVVCNIEGRTPLDFYVVSDTAAPVFLFTEDGKVDREEVKHIRMNPEAPKKSDLSQDLNDPTPASDPRRNAEDRKLMTDTMDTISRGYIAVRQQDDEKIAPLQKGLASERLVSSDMKKSLDHALTERNNARAELRREKDSNLSLTAELVRTKRVVSELSDAKAVIEREVQHYCELANGFEERLEESESVGKDLSERLRQSRELHRQVQARVHELEKGLTPSPKSAPVPPMPQDCFRQIKSLSELDAGMSLRVTLSEVYPLSPKVVYGIARRNRTLPSVWECAQKDSTASWCLSSSYNHNEMGTGIKQVEVWDASLEHHNMTGYGNDPYIDVKPVLGPNGVWTVHIEGSPHRLEKLVVGFRGVLGFVYSDATVDRMRLTTIKYGYALSVPNAVRLIRKPVCNTHPVQAGV